MDPPRIQVELAARPADLTASSLPDLTVAGAVTNLGDGTIDTQAYASELRVDGVPSMAWSMAIGNGTRDERESALPRGERVEFRRVMGAGLFSTPGEHTLVLRVRGVDSPPVTVRLADG